MAACSFAPGTATPVVAAEEAVNLSPGEREIVLRLRLPSPQLWHFDQPRLYRMETELADERSRT